MIRATILVVDDKENMRSLLARVLGDTCDVVTAPDGAQAIALLGIRSFDVVMSDVRMPGADGFDVLDAVRRECPETEVILMTAFGSVDAAVGAIKRGAYDYVEKPFDSDRVLRIVERAVERKRLKEQAANLRREVEQRYGLHSLVGKSDTMQRMYRLLERAARTDITVLITGESGTGKELAARAVHYQSGRAKGRFVPVNCGALPLQLVESELFGHAKGAYTGAGGAKRGLFQEAEDGTLFLDEIGELPLSVQVTLNRALQEHEIRPVGETRTVSVNARVIAATNRDLKAEVQAGRFREDLFYRLNVFSVRIPALRERSDDVPMLAAHFMEKHVGCDEPCELDPDALRSLMKYDWPGNVRELENAVERAMVVAEAGVIRATDLPDEIVGHAGSSSLVASLVKLSYRDAVQAARDQFSHDYLGALMTEFSGNVTRAAERAGVERESLHRLLKKHGMKAIDFRGEDEA